MTIKNKFPDVRPALNLDFANTKRLDPRITFTRSSTGTYVDEFGVIKTAASNEARFDHDSDGNSLGLLIEESRTNEFPYSEDFSNSSWTKVNTTVTTNAATAPDSTSTANRLQIGATNGVVYNNTVGGVASNSTISMWVKAVNPGTDDVFRLVSAGDLSGDLTATNEWVRYTFTSNTFTSSLHGIARPADNTAADVYVWGAQFEETKLFPTSYIPTLPAFTSRASTATYYDANGVVQTAGIDVARDNAYLPDESGVFRPVGLLIEESRTNLLTYSEDFSQWIQRNHTYTSNAATAPDGTTTADKIAPNSGTFYPVDVYQTVTPITTPITLSVWAKADGFNVINLNLGNYGDNGVEDAFLKVNVSTGTLVESSGSAGGFWTSYSITPFPNGWYRVTATTTDSTDGDTVILLQVCEDDGSQTVTTGDGTKGILIWGAQLEAGSFPTSYIPTAGATVTRAADVSSSSTVTRSADVASMTGTNFSSWYNNEQGTVVFNAGLKDSVNATPSIVFGGYLWVTAGSQWRTSGNQSMFNAPSTAYVPALYAFALQSNNHALSINGGSASSPFANNSHSPAGSSFSLNGLGNRLSGLVRRITYYPYRLTNAQLQALTL